MRELSLAGYAGSRHLQTDGLSRWVAVDLNMGATTRQLILRHLLPDLASKEAMRGLWLQAGERNAQLSHPCVRKVVDWGVWDASTCIAQEHLPGTSLAKLLSAARGGKERLSASLAVHVGRSLLSALSYAEAAAPGLQHLDVRPERVHVDDEGSVLLAEFGLWSLLEPAEITRRRFDAGEVHYLAPEVVQSLPNDTRSDLFSVGSILFEMLSAQRAFGGATSLAAAMEIGAGRLRNVRSSCEAPQGLCEIVERLLAHRPEHRYQSAREAADALSAFEDLQNQGCLELSARVAGRAMSVMPVAPVTRKRTGLALSEQTAFEVPQQRPHTSDERKPSSASWLAGGRPGDRGLGGVQSAAPSTTPYVQVPPFAGSQLERSASPLAPLREPLSSQSMPPGRSVSVEAPAMFVPVPSERARVDGHLVSGFGGEPARTGPLASDRSAASGSVPFKTDGKLPALAPPPMHIGASRPAAVADAFPDFERFTPGVRSDGFGSRGSSAVGEHSEDAPRDVPARGRRGAGAFLLPSDQSSLAELHAAQQKKLPLDGQTGPVFAPPSASGWPSKSDDSGYDASLPGMQLAAGVASGSRQRAAESSARHGRRLMPSFNPAEHDLAAVSGNIAAQSPLGTPLRSVSSSPLFSSLGSGAAAHEDRHQAAQAHPAYEPYVPAHRSRGDKWRDPSQTVFRAKSYASGKTGTAQNKMPLVAVVVLSTVFGSSAVGLLYLLFRMLR